MSWTYPQPHIFKVCLLRCRFTNGPQLCTYCSVDLSIAAVVLRCTCPGTTSLIGRSLFRYLLCCSLISGHRCFKVFWHGLICKQECCKVYLLYCRLFHGHKCTGVYILSCGLIHKSLAQVQSGVSACQVHQHRNSSNALALYQPRHMAMAVTKVIPGRAKQYAKEYSKEMQQKAASNKL